MGVAVLPGPQRLQQAGKGHDGHVADGKDGQACRHNAAHHSMANQELMHITSHSGSDYNTDFGNSSSIVDHK